MKLAFVFAGQGSQKEGRDGICTSAILSFEKLLTVWLMIKYAGTVLIRRWRSFPAQRSLSRVW